MSARSETRAAVSDVRACRPVDSVPSVPAIARVVPPATAVTSPASSTDATVASGISYVVAGAAPTLSTRPFE
jgi:hypothetical protein